MSSAAPQLLRDVLELPSTERALFAERLLESLGDDGKFELSDAWVAEIERRCRQIDSGEVELIPGDEALARAYAVIRPAQEGGN